MAADADGPWESTRVYGESRSTAATVVMGRIVRAVRAMPAALYKQSLPGNPAIRRCRSCWLSVGLCPSALGSDGKYIINICKSQANAYICCTISLPAVTSKYIGVKSVVLVFEL